MQRSRPKRSRQNRAKQAEMPRIVVPRPAVRTESRRRERQVGAPQSCNSRKKLAGSCIAAGVRRMFNYATGIVNAGNRGLSMHRIICRRYAA